MPTVKQPTYRPTNKLTAATVAAVAMAGSRVVVTNYWPEWYDPALWDSMLPVVIFGAGYIVRDRANVEAPVAEDDGGEEFLA